MTDPTRAFTTDHGRFYRHVAAKLQGYDDPLHPHAPRPSITNIMKMLDEGFLPGYYTKLVAEYAVNERELVEKMRVLYGDQTAIDLLKAVPEQPHPNGAIGDNIHAWIDAFHKQKSSEFFKNVKLPELETPQARKMAVQYQGFFEEFSPRVIQTEYTVWSYSHGYAGTMDAAWELNGIPWIIDYKSGTRIYPKTGMQLAAGKMAEAMFTEAGEEQPNIRVQKAGVIHLRPMSCRLYEIEHIDECWKAFLGCKALFDWTRFWKETVIPLTPSFEHKSSIKGVK